MARRLRFDRTSNARALKDLACSFTDPIQHTALVSAKHSILSSVATEVASVEEVVCECDVDDDNGHEDHSVDYDDELNVELKMIRG